VSIVEKAIDKLRKSAEPVVPEPVARPAAPAPVAPVTVPDAAASAAARAALYRTQITIDRRRLRESGLLPPEHEESRLAAEYRRIKRPLLGKALSPGAPAGERVILIASATPGEGKTFTSLNLAFSMSLEHETRVLLVDCDIPKPQLSTVLGLATSPGLFDALSDPQVDVESCVCDTDVPNLTVLPVGHKHDRATEMLASRRMQDVVARLLEADPHRVIVFDSPPLLLTTESAALAAIAGQVVLVVRAETTPKAAVQDALRQLGAGKSVSLVLNDVEAWAGMGGYYTYGHYGPYPTTR
jgi:exopolysaccharide/PEP-CTERM locus tyrosine autokinase